MAHVLRDNTAPSSTAITASLRSKIFLEITYAVVCLPSIGRHCPSGAYTKAPRTELNTKSSDGSSSHSVTALVLKSPVQLTGDPIEGCSSRRRTFAPFKAA